MKTFIADIFPAIERYSQKLDNLTLLTNQRWVSIDNITSNKTVYIFRNNNELLVSSNGKIAKAKWEYLGNRSILIDKYPESYLFKHGFLDENVLALKLDSKEEYAVFVNENKYDGDLNSIERVTSFLKYKYISSKKGRRTINKQESLAQLSHQEKVVEESVSELKISLLLICVVVLIILVVSFC